jgi:hypothetical protein
MNDEKDEMVKKVTMLSMEAIKEMFINKNVDKATFFFHCGCIEAGLHYFREMFVEDLEY